MGRISTFALQLDESTARRVRVLSESGKATPNDILQVAVTLGLKVLEHEMNERQRVRRVKQFVEVLSDDAR